MIPVITTVPVSANIPSAVVAGTAGVANAATAGQVVYSATGGPNQSGGSESQIGRGNETRQAVVNNNSNINSNNNIIIKNKPDQIHHFATNKSQKYTARFEKISKKYNLNLDDPWNKELMPHQGRHPNEYHDYVLDQMKKFDMVSKGNKDVFLKLYEQMKQKIIGKPEMLTKEYWRNK